MSFRARLPRPGVEIKPQDEVAVLGLARSGRAVVELLIAEGYPVYASDASTSAEVLETAESLRSKGAVADAGVHDLKRIARAALVVLSPGIPPDAPPVQAARAAGRPIISEVEVALEFLRESKIIAVTGTNGKTTTTALIAH